MSNVPIGELRRSRDSLEVQVSVIRTEHNFVLALPVHREEVHPFVGKFRCELVRERQFTR